MNTTPRVLFVCVKNGGKSQMAAGLMRHAAGEAVLVDSAGTRPGTTINALAAEVLTEIGIDITDQTPKQLMATGYRRNLAYLATLIKTQLGRDGSAGNRAMVDHRPQT